MSKFTKKRAIKKFAKKLLSNPDSRGIYLSLNTQEKLVKEDFVTLISYCSPLLLGDFNSNVTEDVSLSYEKKMCDLGLVDIFFAYRSLEDGVRGSDLFIELCHMRHENFIKFSETASEQVKSSIEWNLVDIWFRSMIALDGIKQTRIVRFDEGDTYKDTLRTLIWANTHKKFVNTVYDLGGLDKVMKVKPFLLVDYGDDIYKLERVGNKRKYLSCVKVTSEEPEYEEYKKRLKNIAPYEASEWFVETYVDALEEVMESPKFKPYFTVAKEYAALANKVYRLN